MGPSLNKSTVKDVNMKPLVKWRRMMKVWKHILAVIVMTYGTDLVAQEISHASFQIGKFHNKRDSYFPYYHLLQESGKGEHWTHGVSMDVDMDIIKNPDGLLYWDQTITGNTTNVQYREVSWDFELGINVMSKYVIFWHHTSRHWLEGPHRSGQFVPDISGTGDRRYPYPLEDLMGIRVCLLGCEGWRN